MVAGWEMTKGKIFKKNCLIRKLKVMCVNYRKNH